MVANLEIENEERTPTEPMSKAVEMENCYFLHIPGIYVRGTQTESYSALHIA